jgi:hypothetical protein
MPLIRRIAVCLLAGTGVWFAAATGVASIIISEIMYNPQGTDVQTATPAFNKEWVEIYNAGQSTVDLGGWRLEDVQDGEVATPLPLGTMLAPQTALVLTGDAATFDAQWGAGLPRLQIGGFPSLANTPSPTNELLALRDAAGTIRDQVNYDASAGWPSLNGSHGASIFVKPEGLFAAGNDAGVNWAPSSYGLYGGRYADGSGLGENHGSPGVVAAVAQPAFAPSPDAAWSLVVIPDTQNYVKSSADLPRLFAMTNWIKDRRDEFRIQAVLQEGDIVNQNSQVAPTSGDQTAVQQWTNARNAFAVLNGVVPYVMATGNHDYGTTSAQDRSTQFNSYFKAADNPLVDPASGGVLAGTMQAGRLENAYYDFTAPDGRKMLVFSLEWGPRQDVVNWANQVASRPEYADRSAVVLTHAYAYHDETRYDWARNQDADPSNDQSGNPYSYGTASDTNDGEDLWQELVKRHANIEFVLNGHVGGDGVGFLASPAADGHVVEQMLFNTQFETGGGNGWLRLFEFLNDGKTVRVRTYSPSLVLSKQNSANQFEFQISPLPQAPPRPADFNGDRVVDSGDLAVWRANLGAAGASQSSGDATGDGAVDGADLLVWQQSLGDGAQTGAAATVPEPHLALFAAAIVAALLRPGRRFLRQRDERSPCR